MARTEEGRREPKVFHVGLGSRELGCGGGLDVSRLLETGEAIEA